MNEGPVRGFFARALLLLAIASLIAWWMWPRAAVGLDPSAQPRTVAPAGARSAQESTNIQIYEQASPCVVQVTNLASQSGSMGLDVEEVPKGVGSGFVWDNDGHIVTNNHVVEGADGLRVTLADHSTYDASQVWADPEQDIAVIAIADSKKLPPIPIGTSHDVKVGQIVYALGNPFGLDETMTTGIVSALGRDIAASNGRRIHGVLQTSAPINPGNSGGPLLDSSGRLIGMNTAILSPSGVFAGIGFAIPVDEINHIVPQLIRHGKVVHPRLGVQVAQDQLARHLGVNEGALIVKVLPGGAASRANLQATRRDDSGDIHLGDVIVAVDKEPVKNASDLNEIFQHHKVGDSVTLTIIRDGQRQEVKVTLGSS